MPCETYDSHAQACDAALQEEARLRGDTMQLLRTIGRKATIETRVQARNGLAEAEQRLNQHIDRCPACRADHRLKRNAAKTPPALS